MLFHARYHEKVPDGSDGAGMLAFDHQISSKKVIYTLCRYFG
jgi:hypothetical protein